MNTLRPLLRVSTIDETPMQASKWLQCQVLLDLAEMRALFQELGCLWIYSMGRLCEAHHESISQKEFLEQYGNYVQALKAGQLLDEAQCRHYFSSIITVSPEHLFAILTESGKHLVRIAKPVIQMQPHRMGYSSVDGKFRSMVLGSDSITWGIQFSYPQLFQDNQSGEVKQVVEGDEFPNTSLFRRLQRWVRNHTIPTSFLIEGKKIHIPMRLGKECLAWINQHPQLKEKQLQVIVS